MEGMTRLSPSSRSMHRITTNAVPPIGVMGLLRPYMRLLAESIVALMITRASVRLLRPSQRSTSHPKMLLDEHGTPLRLSYFLFANHLKVVHSLRRTLTKSHGSLESSFPVSHVAPDGVVIFLLGVPLLFILAREKPSRRSETSPRLDYFLGDLWLVNL
jgi:hypothetical protein